MANVKISQLTPKGANLAATDLLEISEFNGSGYETKSITGQEIIDAASGGGAAWGSITGTLSSQTDLQTALDAKQDDLVSGTNIKTINSNSLLGSGNVAVQDTLVSGTNIKTINSTSVLGSGNIAVQPTLVSGTNIKTINSTSLLGSGDISVSGNPSAVGIQSGNATTSNTAGVTISKTITINANTLASSCVLDFTTRMVRLTGTSSMGFIQVYKNTSNSLTGATLIAKANLFNSTDYTNVMQRTFNITGGNLISHNANDPQNTDIITSNNAVSSVAFSVSTTNYILIAINNSSTDQLVINMAKLTQYA
jgi:hypothetical protein